MTKQKALALEIEQLAQWLENSGIEEININKLTRLMRGWRAGRQSRPKHPRCLYCQARRWDMKEYDDEFLPESGYYHQICRDELRAKHDYCQRKEFEV